MSNARKRRPMFSGFNGTGNLLGTSKEQYILPPSSRGVCILTTGGTFDKIWDLAGEVHAFPSRSHVAEILRRLRVSWRAQIRIEPVGLPKDSLDHTDDDRQMILDACRSVPEKILIVVHGTSRMIDTAAVLGQAALAKVVVLTGAFTPFCHKAEDASLNLMFALGYALGASPSVYIAMHGQRFSWDNVRKNSDTMRFEAVRGDPRGCCSRRCRRSARTRCSRHR